MFVFKIEFIFFSGVIFHCVHGPLLLGAFLCWWTFSLLPSVGYGKYCWSAGLPACDFWFAFSHMIVPSVGILDWLLAQCLPFQNTSIVFSLVALTTSHLALSVRISPQPLQHLSFAEFLLMAILIGVSWQVYVIWICMSLIIPNVQHFSTPFSVK